VTDRPAGGKLSTDLLEPGAELGQSPASGLGAHAVELTGASAGGDQVAAVLLACPGDEPGEGGGADPAARRADRAAERLGVDGVGEQREVGECVADLGALVQAERAEHAVRDPGVRERPLERLGRVAGPREREDLGRRRAASELVGDLSGDPVRLCVLVLKRSHAYLAAGPAHRDHRLPGPALVVAHGPDGGLEDLRARAEVPPEHDLRVAGVALSEAEDVPGVGMPPAVDQLIVVAAHAQVPVRPGEQVDKRRLSVAGVLELVSQDPPPLLAQPCQAVRVL
jgi:hypothetical protein